MSLRISFDRIAAASSLLGLYLYHDAIKKELERPFDMKADEIEEYTPFVAGVKIDPQACTITEKSI